MIAFALAQQRHYADQGRYGTADDVAPYLGERPSPVFVEPFLSFASQRGTFYWSKQLRDATFKLLGTADGRVRLLVNGVERPLDPQAVITAEGWSGEALKDEVPTEGARREKAAAGFGGEL